MAKIYADTMFMPLSGGYKYIVHARCSVTHFVEAIALKRETGRAITKFMFEELLYRYGALTEIVTDNGKPFIKALESLHDDFKVPVHHIRISDYNSRANGIVERSHFDLRQSLFKAAHGNENKWHRHLYSVLWADRVTVRHRMGCSPYFALTGTHPILPLDVAEATYLQPPPTSFPISTADLIARRSLDLLKRHEDLARIHYNVYKARIEAACRFEAEHAATIHDYDFKAGSLMLMRNTHYDKGLKNKTRSRYLGLLVIISRNRSGAYIVCELGGSVHHCPIAVFRLIPYFAQQLITLPNLDGLLDISMARLREMEDSDKADDDDEGDGEGLVDEELNN
ncbi:unnamed protein product [Peniophora sp. CBMAI 1063]|nr:unnamed protein product [Peniophora sp. CBMAI 1063]